jgi:Spy/CpxP family protein refolding chaperone
MSRTALKWLLAASLALNLGVVAALVAERVRPSADTHATQSVNLPDYLQLTPAQRERWSAIEHGFLRDIAANWDAIRTHRETLVRQIFSAAPNRAAIDAEQAGIAALQDAQQRRVIDQLLAERELLDERQRARLMELLLNRYTRESTEEEQLHR